MSSPDPAKPRIMPPLYPQPRFALQLGRRKIEYLHRYGLDARSGWCVTIGRCVMFPQFCGFIKAAWMFVRA